MCGSGDGERDVEGCVGVRSAVYGAAPPLRRESAPWRQRAHFFRAARDQAQNIFFNSRAPCGRQLQFTFLWEEFTDRLRDCGVYQNLLDSCLRIIRCLQFESATLRGPLMSDASQLLLLVWHYVQPPRAAKYVFDELARKAA